MLDQNQESACCSAKSRCRHDRHWWGKARRLCPCTGSALHAWVIPIAVRLDIPVGCKAPYPAGLNAPVSSSCARLSHEGTAPHSLSSSSGATSSGGSELAMAAYASEVMVSASLGEIAG